MKALVNYLLTTKAHVVFKEALTRVFLPRDMDPLCTAHTDHAKDTELVRKGLRTSEAAVLS